MVVGPAAGMHNYISEFPPARMYYAGALSGRCTRWMYVP